MEFRRCHFNETLQVEGPDGKPVAFTFTTTFNEFLQKVYDDGERVIVKDQNGNVMFNGSAALFKACWDKGYFVRY